MDRHQVCLVSHINLYMLYLFYRCETFNGVMRERNLHGNQQASSRDITTNFAIIEQLLCAKVVLIKLENLKCTSHDPSFAQC